MDLKFNQYAVDLEFGLYGNGNIAMVFMGAKDSEYQGQQIAVATVNGDAVLNDPDVCGFIKTWNGNVKIIDALADNGIIDRTPVFDEPAGFSTIQYHCLTKKGQALRDASL